MEINSTIRNQGIIKPILYIFLIATSFKLASASSESTSTNESNQDENICEEESYEADIALFAFFVVLVGLVIRYLGKKVPIPYTALLLVRLKLNYLN